MIANLDIKTLKNEIKNSSKSQNIGHNDTKKKQENHCKSIKKTYFKKQNKNKFLRLKIQNVQCFKTQKTNAEKSLQKHQKNVF